VAAASINDAVARRADVAIAGAGVTGLSIARNGGDVEADAVAGAGAGEALEILDIGRFDAGRLVPEPHVI
jgi:hypothetical protein